MINKNELINLAKEAIKTKLEGRNFIIDEKIKKKFKEKRACFVTLILDGKLRGCVGSLTARQELWKDVLENAINSAFFDSRFYPLTKKEFDKIKIEISVLNVPKEIEYKNEGELKKKIFKKGVIIKKGYCSATYLPQVWGQIQDKDEFLSSLCLKAGLNASAWKKEKLNVFVYDIEKVRE